MTFERSSSLRHLRNTRVHLSLEVPICFLRFERPNWPKATELTNSFFENHNGMQRLLPCHQSVVYNKSALPNVERWRAITLIVSVDDTIAIMSLTSAGSKLSSSSWINPESLDWWLVLTGATLLGDCRCISCIWPTVTPTKWLFTSSFKWSRSAASKI